MGRADAEPCRPVLFDSHCHLQDPAFEWDREIVLNRALAELEGVVVVGDALETSEAAMQLCRLAGRAYAAVGIHPQHAVSANEETLEKLRLLAQGLGVVAIGEIGLDYAPRNAVPHEKQHAAFLAQLRLAADLDLPVVVHQRAAQEDLAAIIESHARLGLRGVMHCFSGDAAFAERCMSWGFFISFAGNVTFPKAEKLRAAARAVPLDRLLLETDSPYLAPQPVRGKRCEPTFICHTAATLAELHGTPLQELARHTTRNARMLFQTNKTRR